MAFTLNYETSYIQPVYNEIVFVASESDSDQLTEFEIVAAVSVEGTAISNMRVQPNPDGYSVFDLHRIIESEISFDFQPSAATPTFQLNNETLKYYNVAFTSEGTALSRIAIADVGGFMRISTNIEHGLTVGDTVTIIDSSVPSYNGTFTTTSFPSSTSMIVNGTFVSSTVTGDGALLKGDGSKWSLTGDTTANKYVFNGIVDWVDFPSYDFGDVIISAPDDDAFFNSLDITKTFDIDIDSRLWINYFFDPGYGDAHVGTITATTNNGVFEISNPYSAASETNKSQSIRVGPYDLLNTTSTVNVLSGSLPMFDSNSTDYTITFGYLLGVYESNYSFNIPDYCSNYDKYNFLYLDKGGSWIPVTFNLLSKTKVNMKKTNYEKGYGTFNGSTWGYNTYDRGKTRLNTQLNQVITISSDWVSEYMGTFYEDMIESPEVFVVDPNGNMQAVNILDTDYDVKTRVNDKLINYTINFEYSNQNGSQRG